MRSFQLPGRAVALVLAGGRGSRLYELTDRRAKPAVYFGGKFRIIDFAMSNCVNSGIRRIGVVTQYKSHSLLRHLQRGWGFLRGEVNEFVDLLPAQQRVDEESWYRGTADAVYQNIDIIETYSPSPDYVVILAGDHVYKMNYAAMLVDLNGINQEIIALVAVRFARAFKRRINGAQTMLQDLREAEQRGKTLALSFALFHQFCQIDAGMGNIRVGANADMAQFIDVVIVIAPPGNIVSTQHLAGFLGAHRNLLHRT